MEEKKLNIYQKLLAISNELSRVAKNLEVGYGQTKYKAVGEADVLAAIKPLEAQYGVYSYPFKRTIIETGELETKTGTKNLFLRIETIYRFVNVEKPDEFIDITSYGDGVDSQDKSVGKAMTYADKYGLMKAYKIITGDDPDQNASEELKVKTANKTVTKPEKAPISESSQSGVTNTNEQPKNSKIPPKMSSQQATIIFGLDDKLKEFACKKFGIAEIGQLNGEQAQYIIDSLIAKGIIK